MSGHTPTLWWCVTTWSKEARSAVFVRETSHTLIKLDGRGVRKANSFEQWYPTKEEADKAIAERLARLADRDADKRVRDAAPDLLKACQAFVDRFDGGSRADTDYVAGLMRAALARATSPESPAR